MDKPMTVGLLLWFLSIATICLCSGSLFSSVPCKQNERQALMEFKKDLKDPSNRLFSWVGEGDCCSWTGVVCDDLTGHVHELHLGNFYDEDTESGASLASTKSLGGKLNPSLLSLTHLTYLDLNNNDFEGIQVPSFFGSIKSLRYLNLSEAQFGGRIPPQLGNLSNLHTLGLYDNHFVVENLQWISGLSQLQHLDISAVYLGRVSDWLKVTDTLPSTLVELYIVECSLDDIPSGIANMTNLTVLNLGWNSINSTLPEWLYSLSYLESLFLSGNRLHGEISTAIGNLTSIVELYLSEINLEGKIPNSLGNLCELTTLDLSMNNFKGMVSEIFESLSRCSSDQIGYLNLAYNNLSGQIPDQIENFKNLQWLDLSSNSIFGAIPASLGNLSFLEKLVLDSNSLTGVVSEVHFTNLTRLTAFCANENSLTLKTSPDWVPPFQLLTLYLNSWRLEPSELPNWFQTQTNLFALNMSNTGISGTIPTWFWNFSSVGLIFLDLSYNQLYGKVPNIVVPDSAVINLGSNQFNGSLPLFSSLVSALDLSNSSFSGTLFHFLCDKSHGPKQLEILQLHNNLLTGEIPNCLLNLPNLTLVNLEDNILTGSIPSSIGHLHLLQSLHLRNNHLSGELPVSLQKSESLFLLDLSKNKFVGRIPLGFGKSLSNLGVLSLRSNKLHGEIPSELCNLKHLQILDLADNNLSGGIPSCFYNFTPMLNFSSSGAPILFPTASFGGIGADFEKDYIENAVLVRKGREDDYNKLLPLVTSLDLSNNSISGEIPEELTRLIGLQSLNLSQNLLRGRIPSKIREMRLMESLDLSMNSLSGEISPSMSSLTFLNYLNLSYNNLVGKIPTGTQLQSFTLFSYFGNELCGPPLEENCSNGVMLPIGDEKYDGGHLLEDGWFYLSLGLGFACGFWCVLGLLLLNMPWSNAFSQFLNNIVNKLMR